MSEIVNLLELGREAENQPLELVRITRDEVPIIPFTMEGRPIALHYCNQPEIRGYVACIGTSCCLCRAGYKTEQRVLLPVYVPVDKRIGVLLVSTQMRPHSLLPQLIQQVRDAEQRQERVVLFVSRDESYRYAVTAGAARDGDDDGAAAIKQFQADVAENKVDLTSVVQHLTEEQLRAVPDIQRRLELKEGA
jgi:hypothetical protein